MALIGKSAIFIATTVAVLASAVISFAATEVLAKDVSFEEAARSFRGFSVLSNSPPAPAVKLKNEAGDAVTLKAYAGKVVMLNLWATWCPPCIKEMPDLNALQKEFEGRDFVVLPVASGRQGREDAAEFLRRRELRALTTLYDPKSSLLKLFGLKTLPSTFFIDRKGNMRGGALGALDWTSPKTKAMIDALLKE